MKRTRRRQRRRKTRKYGGDVDDTSLIYHNLETQLHNIMKLLYNLAQHTNTNLMFNESDFGENSSMFSQTKQIINELARVTKNERDFSDTLLRALHLNEQFDDNVYEKIDDFRRNFQKQMRDLKMLNKCGTRNICINCKQQKKLFKLDCGDFICLRCYRGFCPYHQTRAGVEC